MTRWLTVDPAVPAGPTTAAGPVHVAQRRSALARLGVLLLLLALLPLHVLAPFLHAHTETDPRAGMQTGLHLPGLEALEDDTRHGPTWGLRNPPLIEEADLGRRQTNHDLDDAAASVQDLQPLPATQRIAPVGHDASPPGQAPPAPSARAPPAGVSVDV